MFCNIFFYLSKYSRTFLLKSFDSVFVSEVLIYMDVSHIPTLVG